MQKPVLELSPGGRVGPWQRKQLALKTARSTEDAFVSHVGGGLEANMLHGLYSQGGSESPNIRVSHRDLVVRDEHSGSPS